MTLDHNLVNVWNKLSIDDGFIGSDNISLKYNYLKIWNLSAKKNITILRNHFKVLQNS